MRSTRTAWRLLLAALLLALAARPAAALITVGGADPVPDGAWPTGALKVANLPTRISYWEGPPFGGGEYHFQYVCRDTDQFNEALRAFGGILAPRLELVVMDGPQPNRFASGDDARKAPNIHWEFVIWDTRSFHELNSVPGRIVLSDAPAFRKPLPAPQITLYLSDESPIDWAAVKVPAGVQVLDRRVATSPYADSPGGVVRCTVYDMATGKVLPGAAVSVCRHAGGEWVEVRGGRTDEEGVAVLRDIPKGSHSVRVSAAGYAPRDAGYITNLGRTLALFDEVRLSPAAEVSGQVTDSAGNPLEGVRVWLMGVVGLDGFGYGRHGTETVTGKDGRFTLSPLPTGYCSLSLAREGYHYFSFEVYKTPARDLKLVMAAAGVVRGRVKGAVPAAASIELKPEGDPRGKWGGSMRLNPDGSFEFKGVPAGTYFLSLSDGGRDDPAAARKVVLAAGQTVEVELEAAAAPR